MAFATNKTSFAVEAYWRRNKSAYGNPTDQSDRLDHSVEDGDAEKTDRCEFD